MRDRKPKGEVVAGNVDTASTKREELAGRSLPTKKDTFHGLAWPTPTAIRRHPACDLHVSNLDM